MEERAALGPEEANFDEYSECPAAPRTALIDPTLDGQRLDAAASRLFPEFSRVKLKEFIEQGLLCINGSPVTKPRQPVAKGQQLSLYAPIAEAGVVQAEDLPLNVVYADTHVLVINKPAGLVVHPATGVPNGTVQNAVLFHYPDTCRITRHGLIHRLDKDTTGLMVIALSEAAHTALTAAMARRDIRRVYTALVNGEMVSGGSVEAPVGRHPKDRLRMAVTSGGKPALTHYRVLERFVGQTLLEVKLETGRTHQIRVHMAHLKMPVAGDPLYGGQRYRLRGQSERVVTALRGFTRQALHATELSFAHPVTQAPLHFTAPLPSDFVTLLGHLRAEAPL